LKDGARVWVISAESRLEAADSRLADHDTGEVREMLDAAEDDIAEAAVVIQGHLAEFLSRRQQWNAWIKQTLEESRRTDRPVILVDKLNHECYVLRRGRVIDSYPVELGGEWMLAKLREGDQATPEGCYRVTALKGGSRFYKAALLSYPNETDRARFVRAKRTGQLPGGARIGGMIEIHGEGGRGADWTAGCVSLTNRDFDRFLRNVQPGTQVTIVGLWQEPSWLKSVGSPDSGRPEAGSD
jgi:murein L,D-transpeptidase YafK